MKRTVFLLLAAVALSLPVFARGAAGELDASFGVGGKVRTTFGSDGGLGRAVAIEPDGKIVAAGFTESDDFAVARYDPDGSLDQSFGSGGKVVTDFDNSSADIALAAALAPDGKIVVAGGSDAGGALGGFDFALVRYNLDGSLDQSFGSDGKILTDLGSARRFGRVAIQPDGKIVAAGSVRAEATSRSLATTRTAG